LSALNATAAAAASNKNERGGGGGGGVYRAGGPTTLFGGNGWGPYSDGPLNAVRKSILSRDGVGEENWMFMMAKRVTDASAEWGKLRKEAMKVVEGVDGLVMGGALMPPTDASAVIKQAVEEIEEEEEDEEGVQDQVTVDGEKPPVKKRKVGFEIERRAVGVYDPHSHTIHCEGYQLLFGQCTEISLFFFFVDRSDTQPTSARWEAVPDSATKRRVLGGTKTGNGAWALAWVDTIMELPGPGTVNPETALREQYIVPTL
jgi:chromatin structure-remodeling complex protein RSC7